MSPNLEELVAYWARRVREELAHAVGMADEFPSVPFLCDLTDSFNDGEFRPGMVISVESYIARKDGGEGIKLEEQVAITASGIERLSVFPYELDWL